MKNLFLLFFMLSTLGSCSGQDGKNVPDKKTMSVIKKAEQVVYYVLDPLTEDCPNGDIHGFAKNNYTKTLEKNEKDSIVNFVIGNKDNYRKSGKGKFCPPAPQDAFLFIKGKDAVTVVFDLNCAIYTIVNDTLEYEYDFDKIHANVSKVIKQFRQQDSVDIDSSLLVYTSYNTLTDNIKRIIAESDSVDCYLLDPTDKTGSDTLRGFCILEKKSIDAKFVDSLRNILLDDNSFPHSDIVKNCTFLCDMDFRFYLEDEYADVMFAFYCDECVAICGKESVLTDSKVIQKDILKIAKSIFPKDRYIRHLLNTK